VWRSEKIHVIDSIQADSGVGDPPVTPRHGCVSQEHVYGEQNMWTGWRPPTTCCRF
jgi:hypothetical protein